MGGSRVVGTNLKRRICTHACGYGPFMEVPEVYDPLGYSLRYGNWAIPRVQLKGCRPLVALSLEAVLA